eukprot:m.94260 g.94260  ORF g.94260 m.94260 type:complete len:180 (-) comp12408_c0_seq4:87-626(-)
MCWCIIGSTLETLVCVSLHFNDQIPNFLLALPTLTLSACAVVSYVRQRWDVVWRLGFSKGLYVGTVAVISPSPLRSNGRTGFFSASVCVFVFYHTFLTTVTLLITHVQLSTRLLCSSSPLMFWFVASLVHSSSTEKEMEKKKKNSRELTRRFWVTLVVRVWVAYYVMGSVLHPLFLPWT